MRRKDLPQIISIGGALVIIVSAFLPWVRIGIFGIQTAVRGTENYDGWVAFGLGIIGLALVFTKPRLVIIPALFALGLALYEWLDFYQAYANNEEVMDKGLVARAGLGLYLLPTGAIVMGLTSFFFKDNRE